MEKIKRERPEIPVLILSTYDNPTYISRAVALGANGYLLKGASRDELLTAIRNAAAGEKNWSQEEMRRVMGAMHTPRVEADLDDVEISLCHGVSFQGWTVNRRANQVRAGQPGAPSCACGPPQ